MIRAGTRQGLCAGLVSIALGSGCVIPVAPEFEDEDNHPPYIHQSLPEVGGVAGIMGEFTVTVADPNVDDYLYVRWLIDYPGPNARMFEEPPLPPTGRKERDHLDFKVSCVLHAIAEGLLQHRLVLAVADRPFSNPDVESVPELAPLDTVKSGHRVRAVWLLAGSCGR